MSKQKSAYIVVWCSIIGNLLLFALKFYFGQKVNSIAMIADAWHTLSDTLTSLVVLVGFWIATKPPDYEHPFGHGRAESIAAIIVATLLGIVGINFFVESISRLGSKPQINFSIASFIAFGISVVAKELMARFSFIVGKRISSESLIADGWHHRSDAVASFLILIGSLFGTTINWLDGALGIGVSILILYATFEIMKSAAGALLGETPGIEFKQKIMQLAKEVNPAITSVHHFKLHSYGDHKELVIDIRLPADMSVHDAHAIANAVEKTVLYKLKIKTTVHVEPGIATEYLKSSYHY